jgi:hypothetical protein
MRQVGELTTSSANIFVGYCNVRIPCKERVSRQKHFSIRMGMDLNVMLLQKLRCKSRISGKLSAMAKTALRCKGKVGEKRLCMHFSKLQVEIYFYLYKCYLPFDTPNTENRVRA